MRRLIQDALDILSSPRSSVDQQADALQSLEGVLAQALLIQDGSSKLERLDLFVKLQDEFDSNIPTRLLPWLITQTDHVRGFFEKSCSTATDKEDGGPDNIVANIVQSLSIIQGVTLLHHRSKDFMGRKLSLQTILELLSVYRQITHKPLTNSTNSPDKTSSRSGAAHNSLASSVLDTLLCILVDSPSSMRLFEEANGLEIIVKLLKRASNPKDVRMKCLEFLYFYLMDETGAPKRVPTQPSSPVKRSTPLNRPQDLSRNTTSSANTSSVANSSNSSFSSFESWSPSFSNAASSTPPQSPTKPRPTKARDPSMQGGPLGMLRKEVDFVPLSPKKMQIAGLGVGKRGGSPVPPLRLGTRQPLQRKPSPLSRDPSGDTFFSSDDRAYGMDSQEASAANETISPSDETPLDPSSVVKSTEDKKRILGQLLGNVDALVEGVKSAGIWGLGE